MASKKRSSRFHRRTERRRLNKYLQGIIIIVITLLLLGGFLSAYYLAADDAAHISNVGASKFCRTDNLPEITAIVIDHTDKITPIQKRAIEIYLSDVAASVKKNGSLRFYAVDDNESDTISSEVELCSPGSKKDVNSLTGNERLAMKRYNEQFASVVGDGLASILNADTAQRSLIMRTIRASAVDSFFGENKEHSYKRIVIVSDMLEHSSNFSLYKAGASFDDFKEMPYWQSVKSDLRNVDVEIVLLPRDGIDSKKTEDLKFFWKMFFTQQGVNTVTFPLI